MNCVTALLERFSSSNSRAEILVQSLFSSRESLRILQRVAAVTAVSLDDSSTYASRHLSTLLLN